MKLRTRRGGPTPRRSERPVEDDHHDDSEMDDEEEEDNEFVMPAPPRRQLPRRSVAPRAPPEPTPVRPRARARAAPKGGVQKRKSVRPSGARPARPARPRTTVAAPTPSRARRAQVRAVVDVEVDDEKDKDSVDGDVTDDKKAEDVEMEVVSDKEKRVAVPKTTIDDLPEEVMLGIFSYFRPPQLCWKIGRVCRRWASWSVAPFLWRGKEYVLSPDPKLSSKRK